MDSFGRSEQFVQQVIASQRQLYAYILTLMPDPNEASDILQQTNMTLWRNVERFSAGTNFIAWARRVAYFAVLDHREKLQRTRLRFSETLLDHLACESESYVEKDDSRVSAMLKCLNELPQHQRELINRRYSQGEMVRNIAASLGQTANSIANSLFRIREVLWKCTQRRMGLEDVI